MLGFIISVLPFLYQRMLAISGNQSLAASLLPIQPVTVSGLAHPSKSQILSVLLGN
jgi:hypothetical protein